MNNFQQVIGNYSFTTQNLIGKGATAHVYQGFRISDKFPVAIKAINLLQNQNQVTKALLDTQKKALKSLKSHQNVIRLLDIIENQQFCYIVTEIYKGVTLKDYIKQKGKMNEDQAISLFKEIVAGYCSVSDLSIIHRDLKPANIMVRQQNNNPVIIDFGYCEVIQTKTVMRAFNVGSPAYMSPQAYTKTLYSQKSDIWGLGIIFYEMLTGQTLDHGLDIKKYFQCLSQNFIAEKLQSFQGVSKQILSQVLRINAQQRISAHKIKYIIDKNMIQKLRNQPKQMRQLNNLFNPLIKKQQSVAKKTFDYQSSGLNGMISNESSRVLKQSVTFKANISMKGGQLMPKQMTQSFEKTTTTTFNQPLQFSKPQNRTVVQSSGRINVAFDKENRVYVQTSQGKTNYVKQIDFTNQGLSGIMRSPPPNQINSIQRKVLIEPRQLNFGVTDNNIRYTNLSSFSRRMI